MNSLIPNSNRVESSPKSCIAPVSAPTATSPPATHTNRQALAPLSPADLHLFNVYAAARFDLDSFLKASALSPAQFVQWASRPDIDEWVTHLVRMLRRAREEAAELDRARAMARLRELIEDPRTPAPERLRQIATLNRTLSMRLLSTPQRTSAPTRPQLGTTVSRDDRDLINRSLAAALLPNSPPASNRGVVASNSRTAALRAAAGAPPDLLTQLAAA